MPSTKRRFNQLFSLTRSKTTYADVSARMESIFMQVGNDRTEQLKKYFVELFSDVFKSGIIFRMNEENRPTFRGRFVNKQALGFANLTNLVFGAMRQMVLEKDPNFGEVPEYFGTTPLERRDMVLAAASGFPALEALEKSGREQDISLLAVAAEHAKEKLKSSTDFKFNPNSRATLNTEISELYVLYEARKAAFEQEMGKHGRFWRLLNFREIAKTRKFLENSEDVFKKAGFDAAVHGPQVKDNISKKLNEFAEFQAGVAESKYQELKDMEAAQKKAASIEQLTVARDKYSNALKLNENESTSLQSMFQPYIEKYGIETTVNGLRVPYLLYDDAAKKFDTLRETAAYESAVKQRFIDIYGHMTRGSLNKYGTADVKEILEDTQKMLDMELRHCTVIYDRPETKPIADNNVFANVSVETLQRRMVQAIGGYRRRSGLEFSSEEKAEIENSIAQIVTDKRLANEAMLKEKENAASTNEKENAVPTDEKENARVHIPMPQLSEAPTIEMQPMVSSDPELEKEQVQKL